MYINAEFILQHLLILYFQRNNRHVKFALQVVTVCTICINMKSGPNFAHIMHLIYSYGSWYAHNKRQCFFLGGRRGTRTPNHFVNLTGESKNFKMLESPLNQLQTYYGYLCDLLSFM
jgi:hypothetical protein